jgi:hypothetical protein
MDEVVENGVVVGWVMFDDSKVMLATYDADLAACRTAWTAQGVVCG